MGEMSLRLLQLNPFIPEDLGPVHNWASKNEQMNSHVH